MAIDRRSDRLVFRQAVNLLAEDIEYVCKVGAAGGALQLCGGWSVVVAVRRALQHVLWCQQVIAVNVEQVEQPRKR